jgi:hypothetical protein
MSDFGTTQKDRMTTGMQTVKTVLMRFQMEMKTLVEDHLCYILTKISSVFYPILRLCGRLNLKVMAS